jgi:hypothetical protein
MARSIIRLLSLALPVPAALAAQAKGKGGAVTMNYGKLKLTQKLSVAIAPGVETR